MCQSLLFDTATGSHWLLAALNLEISWKHRLLSPRGFALKTLDYMLPWWVGTYRKTLQTLMDMATIWSLWVVAWRHGSSDEINARSVEIEVDVNGVKEPWLLMFKNKPITTPIENQNLLVERLVMWWCHLLWPGYRAARYVAAVFRRWLIFANSIAETALVIANAKQQPMVISLS